MFFANDSLTSPGVRHRGLGHDSDLRRQKIGAGRTGTTVNGARITTRTCSVSVRRENRLGQDIEEEKKTRAARGAGYLFGEESKEA
jgi:hypothetical protein